MSGLISAISNFFVFSFSAIFIENAVLARGFGTPRILSVADHGGNLFQFGAILTLMTTLTSFGSYVLTTVVNSFVSELSPAITPFLYVLTLGLIYIAVHIFFQEKMKNYQKIARSLSVATFNTGVLGTMLLVSMKGMTLSQSLGFGVGTGLGYTLALLLVSEGNRKMKNKVVPKAFKGLPAMLLYLGILAMAIYGFAGHQVLF